MNLLEDRKNVFCVRCGMLYEERPWGSNESCNVYGTDYGEHEWETDNIRPLTEEEIKILENAGTQQHDCNRHTPATSCCHCMRKDENATAMWEYAEKAQKALDNWKKMLDDNLQMQSRMMPYTQPKWLDILTGCIRHCKEQNGLPYCKNCGLDIEMIEGAKRGTRTRSRASISIDISQNIPNGRTIERLTS